MTLIRGKNVENRLFGSPWASPAASAGICEKIHEQYIDFPPWGLKIPQGWKLLPQQRLARGQKLEYRWSMLPELPDRSEMGRYVALGQIGMEMVAPIVVGLVADHYLGSKPWGVIVGAVLGPVGGFVHLVHLLNKMDSKDSSQSDQEPR